MNRPKAIIFDLDGTLYDHARMKRIVILGLLRHLVSNSHGWRDCLIIRTFRRCREELARQERKNLERLQYEVPAARLGVTPEMVERAVRFWMVDYPSRRIAPCVHPGLREFLGLVGRAGVRIGVFSDYPVADKLAGMGLSFDLLLCATDPEVDRLKPHPRGLLAAAERLGASIGECLFIGDRDDKDGECARRAGMPYLILGRPGANGFSSYRALSARFEQWRA